MDIVETILELQRELGNFTPKERERIKSIVTYTHKCEDYHTQECCGKQLCKSCYMDHVRTSHPTARNFLEKISTGVIITAKFNEKEKEIIRSPEIQATSKGRIKCCGKFRSQNRHQRHCEVHHPKKSQEEILKYKEKPETRRVSSHTLDESIYALTVEEIEKLIAIIREKGNE